MQEKEATQHHQDLLVPPVIHGIWDVDSSNNNIGQSRTIETRNPGHPICPPLSHPTAKSPSIKALPTFLPTT